MVHQPDKWQIVLRLNQEHIFHVAEDTIDRFADVRVEVHRIDNLHILVLRGDFSQRVADLLKATAKTFAAVSRHQNRFLAVVQERIARSEFCLKFAVSQHAVTHPNQRIDDCIAGDENLAVADIFSQQVLT